MNDLVSVVIPVYNTNERFKTCFDSVLNQKYPNIEIILLDDVSADASAQICDVAALSTNIFPVFVIHQSNGGVSRARNRGIDFANGKYLVFIDSDDIVTPDYVSDFMNAREKYPDAGHIWCGFEWSSNQKKCIYSEDEPVSLVDRDHYFELAEKILTQSPCLRIYDVSLLRQHRIKMIEDLSLTEDMLFNLAYLDRVPSKKIGIVNAANYIYLDTDADSLNHKYRENLKEIYDYLLDTIWRYMNQWELTDADSVTKYYDTVYYKSVEILNNTFHPQNTMSYFDKIRFNNEILRSQRFIDSLSSMSIVLPERLIKAYQTKNYFWVRVNDRIVSVYGWFLHKVKSE